MQNKFLRTSLLIGCSLGFFATGSTTWASACVCQGKKSGKPCKILTGVNLDAQQCQTACLQVGWQIGLVSSNPKALCPISL